VLRRRIVLPPEHLYPIDEWRLIEARYSDRYFARAETVFALSNGYLGLRGSFDEGRPAVAPGAFVNGFHETWPIVHAEEAYGLARTGQTMINVPDAMVLRLYVDDEPLFLPTAHLAHYSRVLDMRAGTLSREIEWRTAAGKRVLARSRRLVSLEHRHVCAVEYEVTLPIDAAPVVITSLVLNRQDVHLRDEPGRPAHADPRRPSNLAHRVLNAERLDIEGNRLLMGYRATNSGMTLGMGVDHVVSAGADPDFRVTLESEVGEAVLTVSAEPGVPIRIVKYVSYQSSRSVPPAELVDRCARTLDRSIAEGFDALLSSQRAHLDRFWDRADVQVALGPQTGRVQQAVRWNLFQVAQATWRAEGAGVPAKGLTGQAYEGHYFWDTEVYVLPFLTYTQPRIARNLLAFRHSLLARASERAAELGQRGALFAWRTIDGREASAYYQAGTAQYHINADIVHALRRYVEVGGDDDFLFEVGAVILVETARLWEDLGFYSDDGRFHIHGVTGPDEYTTVVNDNTYTNLMARLNLNFAVATLRRMAAERPGEHAALVSELDLEPAEVEAWERAAATMYVPYDEERAIHPQDVNFLKREVWDLKATPDEQFPLLLHYHPLVIYRHQVIKQADVVLAMFLLGNEFDEAHKRANFDYYDALTTGDSSLSACIQSIVAAEVGYERRAIDYFVYALAMDLADVAGNASDGVHIASAAGVWQSLVFGFGGVRDLGGQLSISSRLPSMWTSLRFSLRFRRRQLRVQLGHDAERYALDEGPPLQITIRGKRHELSSDRPLVLELEPGDVAGAAR
jgi:alpha,alpha-trehalose phosphorylase